MKRFLAIFGGASVLALGVSAPVQAATVTVGSPLLGTFINGGASEGDGTLANITVGGPGTHATSPVTGAIVRWHLIFAIGGPFTLRVLHPAGGPAYTAAGSSSPVVVATQGVETFPTALPIKAGDTIGIDVSKGATVGYTGVATSSIESWLPPITEGSTEPWTEGQGGSGVEIGFNAEVQPQPTVTGLNPVSGSLKGGSAVTIAGTDFAAVSAVKFGAAPATSYTVSSEGSISAVAPAGVGGKSDVTVTTVAGTSPVTSADQFNYTACVVPNLKGKKLKAAKNSIAKAGCKLGKVKKLNGATSKTGKVKSQSPKQGKVLVPGTKVAVKLG